MRKTILKTAKGRILAAAVLIAGICGIAAAAWATTCFLPAGNCSTGKVDYHEPDPTPTPEDKCKDFDGNTSKTDYEWKSKTSCFKCTTCTSNSTTKYNCETNSGYAWDSSDGGHCCISGEKWYSSAGACCSTTTGCTCSTLQKWENNKCVCQYEKTSDGTCCEQGKIADGKLCCNSGEHAEKTRCCPALMVEDSNGTCTCAEGYIPDSTGTGCTKKSDDDSNITVKFQYTCNGGACSSDVTDKIKYEFNGSEIGNNISGTAIAKTDWSGYNELNWVIPDGKELVNRDQPYGCSYAGDDCGQKNSGRNGYANDVCNTQGVSTYELDYHDFDFVSNTDVITDGTVADIGLHLLKDESTGKYLYLLDNEFWNIESNCSAADDYDSCILRDAHEVANNEVVLQIPLKGGERCAALNGQKCLYYIVTCPYDTADCMNEQYIYYTIKSSGDSTRVTGGTSSLKRMSNDYLQAKFEETKNYSFEPKNNKIVYYTCDLQKWDEIELVSYTNVIGYAFNLNDQCHTVRNKSQEIKGGPDADQIVSDKLIGYVKIGGESTISGTTVTSNLYVAGTVHDELTISGESVSFSVYYSCGPLADDSHDAHMYGAPVTTIKAGKYYWGTVFTQTGSVLDCDAIVGKTYFSISSNRSYSGTNYLNTVCKNRGEYIKDSKGAYIILCGAKYDYKCNSAM